jgi:hypothetical protein
MKRWGTVGRVEDRPFVKAAQFAPHFLPRSFQPPHNKSKGLRERSTLPSHVDASTRARFEWAEPKEPMIATSFVCVGWQNFLPVHVSFSTDWTFAAGRHPAQLCAPYSLSTHSGGSAGSFMLRPIADSPLPEERCRFTTFASPVSSFATSQRLLHPSYVTDVRSYLGFSRASDPRRAHNADGWRCSGR